MSGETLLFLFLSFQKEPRFRVDHCIDAGGVSGKGDSEGWVRNQGLAHSTCVTLGRPFFMLGSLSFHIWLREGWTTLLVCRPFV